MSEIILQKNIDLSINSTQNVISENLSLEIQDSKEIQQIKLPEYINPSLEVKKGITDNDIKNNLWNSDIEDYVSKIGQMSLIYQKTHSKKARQYLSKYNKSMYTSIMLGPLVGMLSAINMNIGDLLVIPILILCISFFNGILISIIKFRKWDEAALSHKTSSAKYSSLATNVQRQLTLSSKNRDNPDSYMKWITNVFNQIFVSSPIVSLDTIETAFTFNKNKDIKPYFVNYEGMINYEINRLNRQ